MRKVTAAAVAAAFLLTSPGSAAIAAETRVILRAPNAAAAKAFEPRKLASFSAPLGRPWKTFDVKAAARPAAILRAPAQTTQPPSNNIKALPVGEGFEKSTPLRGVDFSVGGGFKPSSDEPILTPAGKKWKSLTETKGWLGGARASGPELEETASEKPSFGRSLGRATAAAALIASPAAAQPFSISALATAGNAFETAGSLGNAVGNGMAFFFPLPEIHQTFKEGHAAKTPKREAWMMITASLALGAINAPLADNPLWGVQNIFGALAMLAVFPLGFLLPRVPRLYAYARDHAMLTTALAATLLLPLSMDFYSVITAAVPFQLTQAFTKAALGNLTFAVALVTGSMYFLLFRPGIISVMRGKEPNGFSPAFSLSFFISAVARTVWTLQIALSSAAYSARWKEYFFLTGLNVVYAAVALASYMIAQKHLKKAP